MTKEPRTREQLAETISKEACATGKCDDLHSVAVLGPVTQGRSNWHIRTSSNGPNLVSAACRVELNLIVGRLQAKHDLEHVPPELKFGRILHGVLDRRFYRH